MQEESESQEGTILCSFGIPLIQSIVSKWEMRLSEMEIQIKMECEPFSSSSAPSSFSLLRCHLVGKIPGPPFNLHSFPLLLLFCSFPLQIDDFNLNRDCMS